MILRHIPYKEEYRTALLNVWEASVRATHTFISAPDLQFYKALVETIDFEALNTNLVLGEDEQMIGFWGTEGHDLLMLFLEPRFIGQGFGKAIMQHIEKIHLITRLEVNEQNKEAVTFYSKLGFEITGRKPLDDYGKPYPILIMQRKL